MNCVKNPIYNQNYSIENVEIGPWAFLLMDRRILRRITIKTRRTRPLPQNENAHSFSFQSHKASAMDSIVRVNGWCFHSEYSEPVVCKYTKRRIDEYSEYVFIKKGPAKFFYSNRSFCTLPCICEMFLLKIQAFIMNNILSFEPSMKFRFHFIPQAPTLCQYYNTVNIRHTCGRFSTHAQAYYIMNWRCDRYFLVFTPADHVL